MIIAFQVADAVESCELLAEIQERRTKLVFDNLDEDLE
jgi:hypothetical protein